MKIDEVARDLAWRVRSLTVPQAIRMITEQGLLYRIVTTDGIMIDAHDSNVLPNRVSLDIIDGIVVDARVA